MYYVWDQAKYNIYIIYMNTCKPIKNKKDEKYLLLKLFELYLFESSLLTDYIFRSSKCLFNI